jgi:flagellar basal body-associated protein FliL
MFGATVAPSWPVPLKSFLSNVFHPATSGILLAPPPVTRTLRDGDVLLMPPTKTPQADAPLPASKPKSKRKLLIIAVLAVVVLAGGGTAAYWMWAGSRTVPDEEATAEGDTGSDAQGETTGKVKSTVAEDAGLVEFPGFLVNLADAGGQAYLRVTLSLLVADEKEAKVFAEKPALKSLLRSSILEVLAQQTGAVLVTPKGKDELKRAIVAKIDALGLEVKVQDVLFSDFVVQY